jgi:hypothetical protein
LNEREKGGEGRESEVEIDNTKEREEGETRGNKGGVEREGVSERDIEL